MRGALLVSILVAATLQASAAPASTTASPEQVIREIDGMRKGPDGLDGDYFLNAQDFSKDWGKNISVSTPVVKNDRATADVELKSSEMGTRKLRVALAKEGGGWKVDKVHGQ